MGLLWSGVKFAIISALVTWIVRSLQFFGFGRHNHTHWPGPCKPVQGITTGAEDGEMISDDLALLTSGLCKGRAASCEDYAGKMLLFDFSQPGRGVTQVKITWKNEEKARDFHPHGMSVWRGEKETTVMVVNHEMGSSDMVELFTFDKKTKTLTHKESVIIPDVIYNNDVKATGPRSFYFTHFFRFLGSRFLFQLELMYLRLPLGWIGHYDGETKKVQVVASGFYLPNSIQMSPDGRYVYLTNMGEQSIDVFQRHPDNSLDLIKRVDVYTNGDNISLDPDNSALWVGGIPNFAKSLMHVGNQRIVVPSQVLKLPLKDGIPTGEVREIYAGNGEAITGPSSLGLYHKSKLLVSSVLDRAAICDVLYE